MVELALAGLTGAAFGFGADRLSSRWPEHEADYRRRGIDWRTLVVVLTGAAVATALMVRWSEPRDLVVLAVYVAVLIVLLATDLDQRILPDLLTLPLIFFAAGALLLGWSPMLADKSLALVSGLAAGIGAPLILFVSDRMLHGELGGGDLKLAVSVGLLSGGSQLFVGVLVAGVGFSVVLVGLIVLRRIGLRSAVPFGPVLIFGAFAAALLG